VPTINIPHSTPIHFGGFTPMGLAVLMENAGFDVCEMGQWGSHKYIDAIFAQHGWPGYDALHVNGVVVNERRNVCQTWTLARKPVA